MEKRGIEGSLFKVDFENSINKQHLYRDFYRSSLEIFDDIFQGGMPDICTGESERNLYYKAYVDTYIEKDVRKLISASSEMQFRRFIEILALRTAQELVYSDISKDLGINVDTCKRWISILQTSGIVYLLQPYMANMSKRIINGIKRLILKKGNE